MTPKIRIDVDAAFGGEVEVVSCYFDRLRPLPLDAHGDFLAAIGSAREAVDGEEGEERKRDPLVVLRAYSALFDAACVEVRHNDQPVPCDKIDARIKLVAVNALIDSWDARVKGHGQPSGATS